MSIWFRHIRQRRRRSDLSAAFGDQASIIDLPFMNKEGGVPYAVTHSTGYTADSAGTRLVSSKGSVKEKAFLDSTFRMSVVDV